MGIENDAAARRKIQQSQWPESVYSNTAGGSMNPKESNKWPKSGIGGKAEGHGHPTSGFPISEEEGDCPCAK